MISNIRITPWTTGTGVRHIATSWQISTVENFSNIIINNEEDHINLTSFSPDLTIPKDQPFYVRIKRHFHDGSSTDWTPIKTLISDEANYSIDVQDDIHINPPSIYVNEEEIYDKNLATFTINSSEYNPSITDKHLSSHWIITDAFGKVLFSRLNDTANLYKLVVNKSDIDLYNMNKIFISVIYRSVLGLETSISTLPVLINDVNYDVDTNLSGVLPYKDLLVSIKPIDENKPLDDYIKIVLIDMDGNPVDAVYNNSGRFTYINGQFLKPGKVLKAKVYGFRNNDDIFREYLVQVSTTDFCKVFPTFNYSEDILHLRDTTITESNFNTVEFPDGNILIPKADNKMYRYSYLSDEFREVNVVDDIDISDMKPNTFTSILLLPNNKMLMDYTTIDNKKAFLIYDYNSEVGTFSNRQQVIRDNEPYLDLFSNYINIINDEEVIYLTQDREVKKFNTETKIVSDISTLPSLNINTCFVTTCKGDILSLWGSEATDSDKRTNDDIYKYNIVNSTWTKFDTIPDSITTDMNIAQARLRKDGKLQLFNGCDDVEKRKDSKSIVYDHLTKSWSVKEAGPEFDDTYRSTVELMNGLFVRIGQTGKAYLFK